MANIFISYSREDCEVASRISESLKSQGLSVFLDMESLVAGEDFSRRIADAVSEADAVVVLLSKHSKRAKWVEHELESALEQDKVVVPILLDSDAKNNWIWPLVSDRRAVTVDEQTNYKLLGQELKRALDRGETPLPMMKSLATSRRGLLKVVGAAIFGALLSSVIVWPGRESVQYSASPPVEALIKVINRDGEDMPNVTIALDANGNVTTDIHGEATIPVEWLGRPVTVRTFDGKKLKSTILPSDAGKVILIRVLPEDVDGSN